MKLNLSACTIHLLYRKIQKALLLSVILLNSFSEQLYATHAAGADLTYQSLGGLVYRLELSFYRDCDGTNEPNTVTLSYKSNSCGYSRTTIAQKVPFNNGLEITFPCVPEISTCNGGSATGIKKWIYSAIVTLPVACSDWVFSYGICCRNCSITTIQSPCSNNSELYVEATLNNLLALGNSSPVYNTMPIAFACIGQNFNFNHGVSDSDGDSLVYELIAPKTSDTTNVSWIQPASTQSPMASSTPFTINAVTGDINFTPSAFQIGVLAMRVNEYRNGLLIGSIIRDMQLYIMNCNNILPVASGINGTSSHITSVCAGDTLRFQIAINDLDSSQSISCTTFNPITGSTLTQSTTIPSLEFCWAPTSADISNQPKSFIVTLNDHACPVNGIQTFSYSIFVNGPDPSIAISNPSCSTTPDGSVTINANSPLPCSYLWNTSPPQTASTVLGLAPGSYSVIVADQNGCSATETVTLLASFVSPEIISVLSGTASCQGGGNAVIQNQVIGGAAPFAYQWNTGATTPSITNLIPGIYSVTVTDANGCTGSDSVALQAPSSNPVAALSVTNPVSCFGGMNGSIQSNVSGGIPPYTFLWNNGAVTPSISQVTSGMYAVTVTDFSGCVGISQIQLPQPSLPLTVLPASIFNVQCSGGAGGVISLSINGGTNPYQYLWSNGSTSPNASNLMADSYSVTVSDANGCTSITTADISEPEPLDISGAIQDVKCYNGNTGSIQMAVYGGVLPYTFLWNTGTNAATPSGLSAGTYTVTVTDGNGCTGISSYEVRQPAIPLLVLPVTVANALCNGDTGGIIEINVNGGTGPYQYLWSNGNTAPASNNLAAGSYSVTVTDANGCTAVATTGISQPPILEISGIEQHVSCYNGQDGSIQLSVTGGTMPCTFLWNSGATVSTPAGLAAGTFTVTVTDANGCQKLKSYEIFQPVAPLLSLPEIISNALCNGGQEGMINLTVNGGTVPYQYVWSTGNTSPVQNNLPAGSYSVTVTDAGGCTAVAAANISQPSPVDVSFVIRDVTCYNGNDGSIQLNVSGGTAPYLYLWNTGATSPASAGLSPGIYTVTVTDGNGCVKAHSYQIHSPSSPVMISGTVNHAGCLNENVGSVLIEVSGGTAPYSYLWNNGIAAAQLTGIAAGNYTVIVTDAEGCTSIEYYAVEDRSDFGLNINGPVVICVGETVTLIADSVPGGNYQWFYEGSPLNGATSGMFVTPASGSYYVILTHPCGTFVSDTVEITVRTVENVAISNNQIICPPETAQLFASGGSVYRWSPESFITFTNIPDPVVSPVKTTLYTVEIINDFGCKAVLNTTVAVICDSLLVPTGFSPNGDGTNDGYVIDGIENYPGNKLWVYDRWGILVYKAMNYDNLWNGISNVSGITMGKKVPGGTYFFILDLNNQSKPRAGYLIIRG